MSVTAELANLSPEEQRARLARLLRKKAQRSRLAALSFAQERLWFLDQLQPGSPAYNMPVAMHLTGQLDVAALKQSLAEIVRRHETLRTTFAVIDERPVQLIAAALALTPLVVDLREFPKDRREAHARQLAAEEAQHPFDLARGPLVRATLLRLDTEVYLLLVTMHHIVTDGWSMSILIQELAAFYQTCSSGQGSSFVAGEVLPALPLQYSDFARWQREWLQGEVLETQLAYWKQRLSEAPIALELPTDRPRPAVQSARGARQSAVLPQSLSEALKALSQREKITLFVTLLAGFTTLLYRYTEQADIVIGSPIANRTRAELESLIGVFVNTLALRTDLSGNPTFRALLGRMRATTLEAYDHQDLPFEMLVEALGLERHMSRAPLFQVMFVLQNMQSTPLPPLQLPGLTLSPLEVDSGTSKFELSLIVVDTASGLRATFEYNVDLFDAATIERMIGHFQTLLSDAVANPDRRLADLALLTESERQQLLIEWNSTQTAYPQQGCIHELFEEQVERTPDAVAVVFERRTTNDERRTTKETRRQGDKETRGGNNLQSARATDHGQRTTDEQLTYRELNERANQLAHHLRSLGVGPDVLVGICMERSIEMVVGLLGILKAGGVYVPLDPTYPKERLTFMLEDTHASWLLTQAHLVDRLAPHSACTICLDTAWPTITQLSISNLQLQIPSDSLSYTIYTSGSTGKPKGAMNSHAGIRNRLLWMQTTYQLTLADRVLHKTPFSFDVSVWELFWPLVAGACLVVALPEGHKDSAYLVQMIVEHGITTLHFVPSMLRVFLDERRLEACSDLKHVICSGEALPFDLVERFFARLNAGLHNLYGPTEAAIDVTCWTCQPENRQQVIPIGRPIANTQLYVLDSHLQPVPIGVPGELHIGGAGLGRGYWERPDLTAEKFIPNPFVKIEDRGLKIEDSRAEVSEMLSSILYPLSSESDRLYRTGDLARYRPGGQIEFLGRMDYQVKVRGFRIELGEIEAALSQHPAVREALLLIGEDERGSQRLVAYVVPTNDQRPTTNDQRPRDKQTSRQADKGREQSTIYNLQSAIPETLSSILYPLSSELRAFLKDKLPDYMIPAAFVMLEALPLMPNGKVNRSALPSPDQDRPNLEVAFTAPRTPTEEVLAGILAKVLGLEQVGGHSVIGVHDNFFELGGHSLLATQVISRVRQTFQVELPLSELFKAPTVAGLADSIVRTRRAEQRLQLPPIVLVPRDGNLPLSFAQQRVWFLDQLEPGNPAYNIPIAVRLTGRLNVPALEQSFHEVVQRHEVLRTTFATVEGRPVLVIAPSIDFRFSIWDLGGSPGRNDGCGRVMVGSESENRVVDLRELPETDRETYVEQLATAEAQRSFDLAAGPLVRATLLRLGEEEHVLLLTMHHIVSDGWSMGVLIREIAALYGASGPSPLPEQPIQYADFAHWQRQVLQADILDQELGYWKRQLVGPLPVLELGTPPASAAAAIRGARQTSTFSPPMVHALRALSQQAGVTLFMTLLAALKTLLYRYTGQTDIVVGSPIALRDRAEVEGMLGLFLNTLVLRTDLSGNPTFLELLGRVRRVVLEAFDHKDLPFELLVEKLQPERDLNRNPLFQVVFVMQNTPMPPLELPGLRLSPLPLDTGVEVQVPDMLGLSMRETGEGLLTFLEYRADLSNLKTLDHLQTLLESIIARPQQRLSDLPILPETERRQLLVAWSDTQIDYPNDRCLHQLFEAQVEYTPDAVAVVFDRPTTNDQRPTTNDQRQGDKQTSRQGDKETANPKLNTQHSKLKTSPPPVHPFEPLCLTYRELNERANQLAHELRSLGVGPDVLVGLCVERSLEMVVGLLGILKAGGAYMPLDPTYPPERLAFMLQNSQAPILLTATTDQRPTTTDQRRQGDKETRRQGDGETETQHSTLKTQNFSSILHPPSSILDLVADWPIIAQLPASNFKSHVSPENLAYVIYTSGSTGMPKGAMNSHRGIVNRLLWMQDAYCLTGTERVLQKTPYNFDVSVWEFFWPLLAGACLIIARPEGHKDNAYLVKLISEQQITTLHFVPAMLRVFLEEPGMQACTSLKRVICSGEALPFELQERFFARLDAELHNLYGPTEAAVDVTCWTCERASQQRMVPIGRPIANTQIYLLDAHLNPVPAGIAGELHIGGLGVGRGYLHQPELSAEKFIPNPFAGDKETRRQGDKETRRSPISNLQSPDSGETQHSTLNTQNSRLYKTGDLARYLPDGNIEFLGRLDYQVKMRGFRIEPGEIEITLGQHPHVQAAAVVARDVEQRHGEKRLIAYVVAGHEPAPTANDLRDWVRRHLPEYMVPAAFVFMDTLPLTPSGKVDRRALPAPEASRAERDEEYQAPETPLEETLAEIWTQALGIDQLGIYDNVFNLGAHSLIATQVIHQINETFEINLPLRSLFQEPTVAGLAVLIEQTLINQIKESAIDSEVSE